MTAIQATFKTNSNKEANRDGGNGPNAVRNLRKWLSAFLGIAGLLLIVVPLAITQINARRNEDIIEQFLREAQRASEEEIVVPVLDESPEPDDTELSAPSSSPSPSPSDERNGTEDEAIEENPAPTPAKKPLMSAEEIKKG